MALPTIEQLWADGLRYDAATCTLHAQIAAKLGGDVTAIRDPYTNESSLLVRNPSFV